MNLSRPFVVYMEDAPRRGGSGAHLRFFSNLRALSDIGAAIHLVRFVRRDSAPWLGDDEIQLVSDTQVALSRAPANRNLFARLAYRFALPTRQATQMYFSNDITIESTMRTMAMRFPNAVHVVEGESLAAAAIHSDIEWIWSEHERMSASISQLQLALPHDVQRAQRKSMARERAFAAALDGSIVRRVRGSILISSDTATWLGAQAGSAPGVYLPTSLYDDQTPWPVRPILGADDMLSLVHLGSISHLPSFTSLQYLLGEVFPRLSKQTIGKFHLTIVGSVDPQHKRAQEILALAERFSNVTIAGFANDLRSVYAGHHAQLIASTQGAGIRTRVVESLARGMPLIATARSFDGLAGVISDKHFALLPNSPEQAAFAFAEVVEDPCALSQMGVAGRTLYEERLSRSVVSKLLRQFLTDLPA